MVVVAPKFVTCFDEAFNRISKRKQMDVSVIFFDEKKEERVTAYICSHFMGHAEADKAMKSLKDVHGSLDMTHNLVQLSTDGPNVNWATYAMIKDDRIKDDPNAPVMLGIGSCGLHVLHGAYGTAQKKTDWVVKQYLRAIYFIFFKIAPARKEDFLKANDLLEEHEFKDSAYLFAQKFCSHRWLENGIAMIRPIEMRDNLKRYLSFAKDQRSVPKKDDRFEVLQRELGSAMHPAVMHFSLCIANEMEPFLAQFQAERPLAVFLFKKLKDC